jgi:hypothetical protein
VAEFTWGQLMQDAKKASEPIAEGQHKVRIVEASATRSSTGKLMFVIKAEILEGNDAKRKITSNLTLSPDNGTALAIFFRNMEAIGIPESFFTQEPNPDQVASAMIGRECGIVVKHGEWQGVKRGNVDRWIQLGGGLGGLPTGPVAPGAVVGAPGPVLPTSSSSPAAAPVVGNGPIVGAGPTAPDAAPPLPI